jgi:hypothetical protein
MSNGGCRWRGVKSRAACAVAWVLMTSFAPLLLHGGDVKPTTGRRKPLEVLSGRQSAVKSLKVVFEGTKLIPRHALGDRRGTPFPEEDLALPIKKTLFIDLENGKIRTETEQMLVPGPHDTKPPRPQFSVVVYNGHSTSRYRPPERNAEGGTFVALADLGAGSAAPSIMFIDSMPVFWSLGIFSENALSLPHFRDDLSRTGLEDVATIANQTNAPHRTENSQSFAELRLLKKDSNALSTWILDCDKDCAVVDYSRRITDKPGRAASQSVHVSECRDYPFGWFPTQWTIRMGASPTLRSQSTYRVTSIEANLNWPATFFEVPERFLAPGMIVAHKDRLREVGFDGKSLLPLSPRHTTPEPSPPISRLYLILAVNAALAAIITVFVLVARRRRLRQ